MRRFRLSREADVDITNIYARIAEEDLRTATLAVDRIEKTIESVCLFPQMGKETARPGVWVFGGGGRSPFRITYRFDDAFVEVVRVFRASRQHVQY